MNTRILKVRRRYWTENARKSPFGVVEVSIGNTSGLAFADGSFRYMGSTPLYQRIMHCIIYSGGFNRDGTLHRKYIHRMLKKWKERGF